MSDSEPALYRDHLPGGGLWSAVIRRHTTLRLTDLQGRANVSLLAYNAAAPLERLNLPDTLKALHTAKLTRGHILMSDMGRALLSITDDTCGWHDPLGGHSHAADVLAQYGEKTYQQARNEWHRNAHDNFLVELGKHGLGPRDLVANVNFFSRLDADDEGRLAFHPGNSSPGAFVDLRAEMDVLVVLTTCPHPLDPATTWCPGAIDLTVRRTPPPSADDFCRNFRLENARCLELTARYFAS